MPALPDPGSRHPENPCAQKNKAGRLRRQHHRLIVRGTGISSFLISANVVDQATVRTVVRKEQQRRGKGQYLSKKHQRHGAPRVKASSLSLCIAALQPRPPRTHTCGVLEQGARAACAQLR